MNRIFLIHSIILVSFSVLSCCNEDSHSSVQNENSDLCQNVIEFADIQIKNMIHAVDSVNAYGGDYLMPVSFDNGKLVGGGIYDWRSGFFPGILWQMYSLKKEEMWKEQAIRQTQQLEDACTYSKHDLGFMFNNSYGKAYEETKDQYYKGILIKAAETLKARYNPNVGCIKSWNTSRKFDFPVIIDNMMNLELLFHVTTLTGDSSFWKIACSHADLTMKNHFRSDGSSYHVVDYDSITGNVIQKRTNQGYSDESYWSRGQAWGLYGFTMCYRFTHEDKYLCQAKRIADFLMSLNYADDLIPYWDMLSPDIPNTVRDASSAAIMASAFLELSTYYKDDFGKIISKRAKELIENLHTHYQCKKGSCCGFLLSHSTTSFKSNKEIDVPLIYADYYYLESVRKLLDN